jgi:hypothetical protein
MQWNPTVLDLTGLRIEAQPRPSYFDRWFNCRIAVTAQPFAGVLETVFTDEDLIEFADTLDQLDPAGEAVLGGDRAAELRLVVEPQLGGAEGALAVECSLTPSGDDPYPSLRWLIFDVRPFAARAARHLRTLAAIQPWPAP